MPTTGLGLPYPASTDQPRGWEQIQALADGVNALLYRPVCVLALSSAFSLASSGSIISVSFPGTEIIDDLAWHDTSTNPSRVTPNKPGRYLVNWNATFAANATGARRLYILKNGSSNRLFTVTPVVTANQTSLAVSGLVVCNGTTDYIEAAALQSSGGALDLQGAGDATFSTSLEVSYWGPLAP